MIKKIIKIQNLGLLRDGCTAGAVDIGRITAIYSDNARGKSTFTTAIHACHLRDAGRMNARKTIDSSGDPEVDLLLSTGTHVEFKAKMWTGTMPAITVFDSEFVEQNVYSGFEIRPDQRQSLLDFALGNQMVQLKLKVEQLSLAIREQTAKRSVAERTLTALAAPFAVQDFVALQPVHDAQQQIDKLRRQIEATKRVLQLNTRKSPEALEPFKFDIQMTFKLLAKTLTDIEQDSEIEVRAHFAKHGQPGIESWVSGGQVFLKRNACPFCGQTIKGLSLIKAYQSYFSTAYEALKTEVAEVESKVASALADAKVDALDAARATNAARIDAWRDQLSFPSPVFDTSQLRSDLEAMRASILTLFATKRQQPLVLVGTADQVAELGEAMAAINVPIQTYNDTIEKIATRIAGFKSKLASENGAVLEVSIERLEAAKRRQMPDTVAIISAYNAVETERKRLEGEKAQARAQIDALMQSTLVQYQNVINQLLRAFGAEFSIEELKPTYVGSTGEPRTEYGLRLRNTAVKLGSRTDLTSGYGFASTLSEADKRTLAFAFFVARLRADPNLVDTIVVLDDPVSSLDRNRRQESKNLIVQLAKDCKQLILLSHDAYFIRDFRDRLVDLKPVPYPLTLLMLKRVQYGYSIFAPCDIDEICSSDYYRHHRLVADFVDGKPTPSSRDVAKAIRPLLEGYYHRRFPGLIPHKMMFGGIIALAVDPKTIGPLSNLRPLERELRNINGYACQFHHDTNQNADTVQVVDTELLIYARSALTLIYQNG